MMKMFSDWFWQPDVWLPPGYTWDHFKTVQLTNNGTERVSPDQFAQFHHLLLPATVPSSAAAQTPHHQDSLQTSCHQDWSPLQIQTLP